MAMMRYDYAWQVHCEKMSCKYGDDETVGGDGESPIITIAMHWLVSCTEEIYGNDKGF